MIYYHEINANNYVEERSIEHRLILIWQMRHLQKAVRTYFIETVSQKESVSNQQITKDLSYRSN